MSETTFQDPIPRPGGPTKRPPLRRTSIPMNDNMGRGNKKSKNTSNVSPPTTPPHSTPKKYPHSPKWDEELKKRGGTPPVFGGYPDLSLMENSNLDESPTSTSGSHSRSASRETQTNDITTTHSTYDTKESFSESLKDKADQRSVDRSREYSQSNNLGGTNRKNKSGSSWGLGSFLGIFLAILAILAYQFSPQSNRTEKSSEIGESSGKDRLIQNIRDLKVLFPSQDKNTWRSFGSGIQDVLTKEHRPAIFVLIASHEETTECLAKKVAELASFTLGGTGDVTLAPDKLENNKSRVLDLMGNRVNQTKAVVVPDLLSMQPEALKAFHDICDEYNPLIAEAVYLLTMRSIIREESGRLNDFVEKKLTQRFSSVIKEDTLKALIVRITTGAVLIIREEKDIPCSG